MTSSPTLTGGHRLRGKEADDVMDAPLDEGYQAMAADKVRETEATEWCNALAGDVSEDAR